MSISRILFEGVFLSSLCAGSVLAAPNPCPYLLGNYSHQNIKYTINPESLVFTVSVGKWKGTTTYKNAGFQNIKIGPFNSISGIYDSGKKSCTYQTIPFTVYWTTGGSSNTYIRSITLQK